MLKTRAFTLMPLFLIATLSAQKLGSVLCFAVPSSAVHSNLGQSISSSVAFPNYDNSWRKLKNKGKLMSTIDDDNSEEKKEQGDNEDVISNVSARGGSNSAALLTKFNIWPCGDELDKQLIKIALPCIANFAINPLIGAVDLFWISRMGNSLAVAGQAAANQVFNSAFWLTSFLPSGV